MPPIFSEPSSLPSREGFWPIVMAAPVIRVGLLMTVAAGILLFFTTSPVIVIVMRGCEGIGAGLFVAAALSYVNSRGDHTRVSGYYMAMLNLGLVLGLMFPAFLRCVLHNRLLGLVSLRSCHWQHWSRISSSIKRRSRPLHSGCRSPKNCREAWRAGVPGCCRTCYIPWAGYGILRSSLSASPASSPRSTRHFPVNQQMCSVSGLRE